MTGKRPSEAYTMYVVKTRSYVAGTARAANHWILTLPPFPLPDSLRSLRLFPDLPDFPDEIISSASTLPPMSMPLLPDLPDLPDELTPSAQLMTSSVSIQRQESSSARSNMPSELDPPFPLPDSSRSLRRLPDLPALPLPDEITSSASMPSALLTQRRRRTVSVLVPALRPRRPEEPDCFLLVCAKNEKNDFERR